MPSAKSSWKDEFLQFCVDCEVLRFGEFTLKSGRSSPYFFNAGLFNTGGRIAKLGRFYARAIAEAGLEFDVLFGPAYKGIPLATSAAIALSEHHSLDVPCSYNRKEAKDHGEGGCIVGAPLTQQRVLIVDDVITAGTAAREAAARGRASTYRCSHSYRACSQAQWRRRSSRVTSTGRAQPPHAAAR